MGWFSKTEDYNYKTEETPYKEIDLNVSVEYARDARGVPPVALKWVPPVAGK